MEALGQAIGAVLSGLPPMVGAAVVVAATIGGLIYIWRLAGRDAKRERADAERARDGAIIARLDDIKAELADMTARVEAVQTSVAILMDRRR